MWGTLPSKLLQAAGGLPFMVPIIDAALNNITCAELDPLVHIQDIIGRIKGETKERPILFEAHNPVENEMELQADVHRVITACNLHEHSLTCIKPTCDYCRMARPQPTIDETRCVQIIFVPQTPEHQEKYIILTKIE